MASARSRMVVVGALACASALFVFELPIRELIHQRGEINATADELATLNARNKTLASAISSLRQNANVSAIAHADYGLVFSGQSSYVVLPGSQVVAGSADTLNDRPIPSSDLVASDASSLVAGSRQKAKTAASSSSGGLVSRTFSHLEFWRWAF